MQYTEHRVSEGVEEDQDVPWIGYFMQQTLHRRASNSDSEAKALCETRTRA